MAGWLIFIYLVGRLRAGARRRVWINIEIKIIASILLVMAYIMVSKISIAIKKSTK